MTSAVRRTLLAASTILSLVASAAPALAHHSFADYDDKKKITVTGVIKNVDFTNPHIHLLLDVRDPAGKAEEWEFGGPSPADWRAGGWVKSDFVMGDTVTITGFPKRDGTKAASINILKTGKGKIWGHEYK